MVMSGVEILAPAGSPDSLRAAIASKASAVYLGLKEFNARGNAINFSTEELAHYVPMAHEAGTKVYLTLNTLVKMNERTGVLEALARAADCGIDGVIFQDLGLGRMMAQYFPQLRRHASTQMAIHNLEGVQFCVNEGFQRVVLARELTLEEISEIRAAFPPEVIELEVFCHGAMCYTYSGMCFFSGSVGGRSGNRGECAYTCRKGYRIHNETDFPMAPDPKSFNNYLFSMKDMNTLEILPQLVATGVDSLKIEGRRKGPSYVHASVQAYRDGLQGLRDQRQDKDLRLAFGREYTGAFYQRGQYGDAPIDITTTGSVGIYVGTINDQGGFVLQEAGLQRYDGLRLVRPDRSEALISFRDYRVSQGDRFRPEKGCTIHLQDKFPGGTRVMWVRSQDVEQKYRPTKERKTSSGEATAQVDMTVRLAESMLTVTASCAYGQVDTTLEVQPSDSGKSAPLRKLLFRFGDTAFLPGAWEGPEEVPGFLPASVLKKTRRELLAALAERSGGGRKLALDQLITEANAGAPVPPGPQADHFILRLDRLDLLENCLPLIDELGATIDFVTRTTLATPDWKKVLALLEPRAAKVRLSLPMVNRKWDLRLLRRRLQQLPESMKQFVLSNPGHIPLIRESVKHKATLHADFSIYHLNTWALQALNDLGIDGRYTLSLEDDWPNMESLLGQADPARFEVIAYTDTPLFIAEACSLAALYGGCPGTKVCGHETLHIENEHGDKFQVRHDRCRSTVIGDQALCWSGHLQRFKQCGVHHFRADFTTRPYQLADVQHIMAAMVADEHLSHTHTENLERILL